MTSPATTAVDEDPSEPTPGEPTSGEPTHGASPAGGPTPAGRLRVVALLTTVFIVAACGLVYELALIALGSYLIGDSIRQTSIVLGVFVFSMGIGSLAVRGATRRPVATFAAIEFALAAVGGLSVLALYASFAWLHVYQPMVVLFAFLIGALIGAELPLLAAMFARIRQQGMGQTVSELFAVDYVGALLGGLAFPFLLLPTVGLLVGTMLVGALNAVCAAVLTMVAFGDELSRRGRLVIGAVGLSVLLVLGAGALLADDFELTARQAIFRDPIVHSERSAFQEIVITEPQIGGRAGDVRLFLNGNLQFSSLDEYRYHESLVHPAMDGPRRNVLILGGGDGLAAREVLRYPDVESVTLVELDPAMIHLARTDERFTSLNHRSLDDPRVHVVEADAFGWLRGEHPTFDVVLIDFPDPDTAAVAKLYSLEFYGMLAGALRPEGRVAIQASSPYYAPLVFWNVDLTLRTAGFATTPFHLDIPSFGDWGFLLATRDAGPSDAGPSDAGLGPVAAPGTGPDLRVPSDAPTVRFVTDEVLAAGRAFPPDQLPTETLEPSSLLHPTILDYQQRSWTTY